MAIAKGPKIITENLLFYIDAGNHKSYSGSGTSINNLGSNTCSIQINGDISYSSLNLGYFSYDNYSGEIDVTGNTHVFVNGFTFETFYNWDGVSQSSFAGLLYANNDGRVLINSNREYLVQSGNTQTNNFYSPVCVDSSVWNHFLYTVDFTNNMEYMYHNNTLVASTSRPNDLQFPIEDFLVGRGYVDDTFYSYSGIISISKIYDKYFNANEVSQNYNNIKSRYV